MGNCLNTEIEEKEIVIQLEKKRRHISAWNWNAGYVGLIFEFLTFEENMKITQLLFRAAYYKHVPPIFKTVYLIPFTRVSKLQPKHEFINMVRTMNSQTHQYLELKYTFKGMVGKLCGEFLINGRKPDGRCRFISDDESVSVLCYFRNGVL